ncbi:hypothetical protein GQ55_1G266700 [Panicum hallii var. hallii]|uniref:Uncharacterized protein n=1 Tax=Panicum hallii var. hallii TaxID=1504633 RepID=A0A2T7F7T7_9POAL|nr:hypothetical protein GQ55_1G266700 [Panicum hallii var. hallii]
MLLHGLVLHFFFSLARFVLFPFRDRSRQRMYVGRTKLRCSIHPFNQITGVFIWSPSIKDGYTAVLMVTSSHACNCTSFNQSLKVLARLRDDRLN